MIRLTALMLMLIAGVAFIHPARAQEPIPVKKTVRAVDVRGYQNLRLTWAVADTPIASGNASSGVFSLAFR